MSIQVSYSPYYRGARASFVRTESLVKAEKAASGISVVFNFTIKTSNAEYTSTGITGANFEKLLRCTRLTNGNVPLCKEILSDIFTGKLEIKPKVKEFNVLV